ncbi:DNA-binding response regulator [Rubrivirga sp. SAORIC476]|uniref:response regulator transcription factor n=1 Tax=Rubrivirga sp. SAORIC476 TaxID=1961794 RepID=UPI000BA93193|nr:response regulator transcription factor [Rubrivirga sp. SAORIC476]PAP80291.1 DNA-binding response regulator [Rubrivirga sp. SAORIC476]
MSPASILVVEDDDDLRQTLARRLSEAGYEVAMAATGPDALAAVAESVPDLVVLDVMLPGLDGIEVCRRLRADHPLLYILMLTARADELDRVVGLEVGADDYVTKPFSLQEVVARIRSALRRVRTVREQMAAAPSADDEAPIVAGGLTVDPVRREVSLDGEEVHLTVREFDLLLFLARHPDRPFTRSQLLQQIWDISYEGYDRTIDSHVQRLRAKIEADAGNPTFIRTVWGVGYKFAGEENGLRSADPG